MRRVKQIPDNEIVVRSAESALKIAEILASDGNDYCVLISREEELWVVNYIWSKYADRNGVVFMSTDDYYDECEVCDKWKPEENDDT